ncbi:MAG: hypothetical protein H0X26_04800 [Alphaproteobacteria bacterium]|nr:hypothetical protein [Alphaproteobacteria bacterium]
MNRNFKFSSFFLLILLTFTISSPNANAEDECAPDGLGGKATAKSMCPDTCKGVEGTWNGEWLGKTNKQCAKPNIYGSVCGCVNERCQCDTDGTQSSSCDEAKNKLGPNKCSSNCDCTQGRSCINGWCNTKPPDIACCNKCDIAALGCEGGCSNKPPVDQPGCLWPCDAEWALCRKQCGGCPSKGKKERDHEKAPTAKEFSTPRAPRKES